MADTTPPVSRRTVLTTVAGGAVVSTAGCLEMLGFGNPDCDFVDAVDPESAQFTWDDLPDLEGEIVVYSGRTSDQVNPIFECLQKHYSDFTIRTDYDDNSTQLNKLTVEGNNSEADVFYSQSSTALSRLTAEGLATQLPQSTAEIVDESIRDPEGHWVATSGRVRAIQYNTDAVDGDTLPDDIFAYAEEDRFAGRIATRPNSGTFRAFIAAMLELEGEERTREWISQMINDQDIELYGSGSAMARAVADGDVDIALGNQYYAARIVSNDPDEPIGLAFTRGDAGALFNVAGVAITQSSDQPELAATFVEHLLAAEGQQFFVDVNGEYPVIDGVEYVGDLPSVEELDPPEFDLRQLVDLDHVVDLLRDEGMTI